MKDESEDLDTCGCCGSETRASGLDNPPGKESLNYRMKVHSTSCRDMLSRLSQPQAPYGGGKEKNPLSGLGTRKRDDPTIAVIDAWAAVGDVLTFYQERICNEGFIRTAKEQRSVLELARSIGYELSPGVAASTSLSFMVEDSLEAPAIAVIPKGTQVESIPGPGELPQIFETTSEITARSIYNELWPRLSRTQPLDSQAPRVYIQGLDNSVNAGDFVLFVDIFCLVGPKDDPAEAKGMRPQQALLRIKEKGELDPSKVMFVSRGDNSGAHLFEKQLWEKAGCDYKQASDWGPWYIRAEQEMSATLGLADSKKAYALCDISIFSAYKDNLAIISLIEAADGAIEGDLISAVSKRVLSVLQEAKLNRTCLVLENPEKMIEKNVPAPEKKLFFTGRKDLDQEDMRKAISRETGKDVQTLGKKWLNREESALNQENLRKVIKSGNVWRESDLASLLSIKGWDPRQAETNLESIKGKPVIEIRKVRAFGLRGPAPNLTVADRSDASGSISKIYPGLYAFKVRSSPFGHNAPRWDSLPDNLRYRSFSGPKPPYPDTWDGLDEPSITVGSNGMDLPDAHFFFERSLPEVVPDDWMLLAGWARKEQVVDRFKGTVNADLFGNVMDMHLMTGTIEDASGSPKATISVAAKGIVRGKAEGTLEGSVQGILKAKDAAKKEDEADKEEILTEAYRVAGVTERTVADYALTGKATGVTLKKPDGTDGKDNLKKFKMRSTTILAASQKLELTEIIIEDPIKSDIQSLELNGFIRNLQKGQRLVITGERYDLEGVTASEVVILSSEPDHIDGFTTIYFEPKLKNAYKRETVKINANVVSADHGETTTEVLGSGNGSDVNQEFILKRKPLTYLSASTPAGREAALRIEVDSVSWKECPSFLEQEDIREKYIIRIDHDQRAHVIFGDGKRGSRLPTGVENVVAVYRNGIGKDGMLAAGKLTLLKTRPHGIRSVTNPLATSGGQVPEDMNQARINARLHALNVKRIVSLKDFEDFALNYPGMGKAQAITIHRGQKKLVHITVATELAAGEGEVKALATHVLDRGSKLYSDLVGAIRQASDSVQPFIVNTYEPCFFNLAAKVLIEEKYKIEIITQKIRESLESAFSFSQREFSQPAASSEVIGIIQNIKGVVSANLDRFYRPWEGPIFRWKSIPGKDNGRLIDFLAKKFGIAWVRNAKIEKIDNDKTISVSDGKNSLSLKLNDTNTKVILEIDGLRRDEFMAKMENDELNIYNSEKNSILEAGCVQLDGDTIKSAELLLINPKGIELELEVKKQ